MYERVFPMRFAKKFVAVAAVLGSMAFASTASAQFTPPSSVAPYLPAANVTTVTLIASFGNVNVYLCSMGGTIAVAKGTPTSNVIVTAESNCAYQKFLAATLAPGSNTNPGVVQAALIWYTSNIYLPYYRPLISTTPAVKRK
jgi:hypothetical protein